MSDASPPPSPAPETPKDLLLDLDFTPSWAKQAPGIKADVRPGRRDWGGASDRRDDRDPSRRGPRRDAPRRDAPREAPRGDRRGAPAERPARAPGDAPVSAGPRPPRPEGERGPRRDDRGERGPMRPRLPIRVDFIPQRDKLAKIVALAKKACQAYPLGQLAAQFMNHADSILVKLTPAPGASADAKFYQSKPTGHVFFNREDVEKHLLATSLDQRFDSAEIEIEAPAGSFPVVARCTLNGALVGPPNHHEYKELCEAIRREKYPQMSPDQFGRHLEMVREPEVIEAWRQSQTKQVRYGVKGAETKDLTRRQAEDLFREKHLSELILETTKCIAPLPALLTGSEPMLSELVRHMHEREKENPFSILLALRPAFKQMGLHLFRARDTQFVTGVTPNPLPATTALVPELANVLAHIQANPGCKFEDLHTHFAPGTAADSVEAGKIRSSLRWLVEKGNVILFFDGTIVVPRAPTPPTPKAAPAAAAEPSAEAAAETAETDGAAEPAEAAEAPAEPETAAPAEIAAEPEAAPEPAAGDQSQA